MAHYVIKVGGAVCAQKETLDMLVDAIGTLHARGDAVTLVHGGGPQLDSALRATGEPVVKHRGLRVTSPEAAVTIRNVLDEIGRTIASGLAAAGIPARHAASGEERFSAMLKVLGDGSDLGRVGTVTSYLPETPPGTFPEHVSVVTPVGFDVYGPLNTNADEAAATVAAAVHADGLVLATDVQAVLAGDGNPLRALGLSEIDGLIGDGTAQGGMIPKLTAAKTALHAHVGWVWIGNPELGAIPAITAGMHPTGTYATPIPGTLVRGPAVRA